MSFRRELRIINKGRVALGGEPLSELPKGEPGCKGKCPIALSYKDLLPSLGITLYQGATWLDPTPGSADALAKAWGTSVQHQHPSVAVVNLPKVLDRFIRRFDKGQNRRYLRLRKEVQPKMRATAC